MLHYGIKEWFNKTKTAHQKIGDLRFGIRERRTTAVWLPAPQDRATFCLALKNTLQHASKAIETEAPPQLGLRESQKLWLVPVCDGSGQALQVVVLDLAEGAPLSALLSQQLCIRVAVILGCHLPDLRVLLVHRNQLTLTFETSVDQGYLYAIASIHGGVVFWKQLFTKEAETLLLQGSLK